MIDLTRNFLVDGNRVISFVVPGNPVAKARPRIMKDGRKYTPSKSKNYENAVAIYAKQVMASDPKMLGPVSMTVRLCMKMPESWSKKRKDEALSGKIAATKKPDCSNVIKGIEDAMNGVVYRDDSQIIEQIIIKRYSAAPQAIITVAEVSASPAP